MNDISDVRFVDSHTEGNRGDDNLNSICHEVVLYLDLCLNLHTSMKGCGIEVVVSELRRKFLGFLVAFISINNDFCTAQSSHLL